MVPGRITEADVEAYQRDGAVCLRAVFAGWVEALIRGLDANLQAPGPFICESTEEGEPGRFFDDYCNWQRIAEYRDYVLNSPAAEIAATAMRGIGQAPQRRPDAPCRPEPPHRRPGALDLWRRPSAACCAGWAAQRAPCRWSKSRR